MIVRVVLSEKLATIFASGGDCLIVPSRNVQKRFRAGEKDLFFHAVMVDGLLEIGERAERPEDWSDG